jgi:AraC-like DNA-binding protein
MVGYSSYSYFLKAFSDICGMTPTEYKEFLQKKDE